MRSYRRLGRLIAATTASATVLAGAPVAFAQDQTVTFSVTNFTDLHGHIEGQTGEKATEMGAARLKALADSVNQDQDYLLTSSGDNIGGSAYVSAISDDEYTLQVLNAMNLAASAVGNHEFDKGIDDLLGRVKSTAQFPLLGANVLQNGKPVLDASVVKEIDGVKVGFVGTVTQNTAQKLAPSSIPGVTFTDPVAATNEEAARLKSSGEADVVVALFHEDAQQFANGFSKDVDALFGGDTHVKSAGSVPREGALPLQWAQGYEYGKVLNDFDFTFDRNSKKLLDVKAAQYSYADAAGLTPNAAIESIVAEAVAKANELGSQVVGNSPAAMYRGSDEGKASGTNRGVESTLNNYIAQAQRVSMSKATGREIDFGVMNAGGVRADLPAGPVTNKDVFTVQPFGNEVAYGTISGADFIKALENQWKPGESRPRLAMGVSDNVAVSYDPTKPQGSRITSVTLDGEKIDPAKDYTVAVSTFLIGGGDGYFAKGAIRDVVNVGYTDTQAMIDYIKSGNTTVRAGQADVGVHVDGELTAGNTIKVDLSSLNYTTEGEPMAKEVTVELGGETVSAPIDNAKRDGDDQFGERGRASVELKIPAGLTGEQELTITTDAGTKISYPLQLTGTNTGEQPGGKTPGGSSFGGGALVAGIVSLLAVLGAFLTGAGLVGDFLPLPIRKMIEDLRAKAGLSSF